MNIIETINSFLSSQGLTFNPKGFVDMLGYMGKGMFVIFILIGVIILTTLVINKIFSKNK